MSQFLYYLPNRNSLSLDSAVQAGLRYAFESAPACRAVSAGPDGTRGVLVAASQDGLSYEPDQQKWRKIPGNEADARVGMWVDSPPSPADLARKMQISGQWLRLDDDHEWLIPKARLFIEHSQYVCHLPQTVDVDDEGQLIEGAIKSRYRRLWSLLMQHEEALAKAAEERTEKGQTQFRYRFEKMAELVASAFQANYRVGLIELLLLEVYDTQTMQSAVVDIIADRERQMDFAKKKLLSETQQAAEPSSGNGSSGPGNSSTVDPSADITQPLQT